MRPPYESPEDRFERRARYVLVWMAWFFIVFAVFVNLAR